MIDMAYGTDKLYRDALLAADRWHQEAREYQEDANYWYRQFVKGGKINAHLVGFIIFQWLVIIGLLVTYFLYGR